MIAAMIFLLLAAGCKEENTTPFINNKLNRSWLEKITGNSDSTYARPYFRSDFVTASYYINKKDSTLSQVMRDSSERVRQVMIEKKGVRTFYAQFYPNGQAIAILPLNAQGQFHGDATLFYPGGQVKSKGSYHNGLYNGVWETYNEEGKLILKEEYGADGQLLKAARY
jgi:antitoxin component YwqK of YwqJK toxin-antitoxin module